MSSGSSDGQEPGRFSIKNKKKKRAPPQPKTKEFQQQLDSIRDDLGT